MLALTQSSLHSSHLTYSKRMSTFLYNVSWLTLLYALWLYHLISVWRKHLYQYPHTHSISYIIWCTYLQLDFIGNGIIAHVSLDTRKTGYILPGRRWAGLMDNGISSRSLRCRMAPGHRKWVYKSCRRSSTQARRYNLQWRHVDLQCFGDLQFIWWLQPSMFRGKDFTRSVWF